jgi:hypothetical protein
MILSIVVTVCHLAMQNPVDNDGFSDPDGLRPIVSTELCHEEVIVEADLPMQACLIGQPQLADWKAHSRFAGPQWRIARHRCVPGHYVVKDAI